ncbi:hypothetical protein AgCh_000173 [Apium graveolens]
MASSVSAFLRRRCRMSRGSLGMIQSFTRSLNSQTKAAAAVLDDPALNYGDRLQKLYEGWENDPNVGFVALKVALLNGITMGGGAGISIPGTFRVATDKTVFATPETLIGFHPDAGASFHLSHLSGCLGEYLALTGDKLNGAEMSACGLATHYSLHAKLPLIEEQIGNLVTDDPSVVEASLEKYSDSVCPDNMNIIQRYEKEDFRLLISALFVNIGVRARMVDKDFAPKWDPPSLEQVSKDMVDQYFSPLNENLGPELELPTTQREAFR